jgi:LysR family glycine cleavage system transcriptional activator
MAIEASKQGQGVVMAGPLLVEDEIANGTLVELFGYPLHLNVGYFVVHPRESVLRKAAENLRAYTKTKIMF